MRCCLTSPIWIATLVATTMACGEDPAPKRSKSGPAASPKVKPAPAVKPPAEVTAGVGLAPLPPPARRLDRSLQEGAQPPERSCADHAPSAVWKLARQFTIRRRGASKAGGKGGAASPDPSQSAGLLELCMFHRWRKVPASERQGRTGRTHLFVAAFPGSTTASWTSDELEFHPRKLPETAPWLPSGWASLIPTGVAETPAIAVISGRFFDGERGEEVHYARQARLLQRQAGRWVWRPWKKLAWSTLDLAHLTAACAAPEAGCSDLGARSKTLKEASQARAAVRTERLTGKKPAQEGKPELDPQSLWLRQARELLAKKRWDDAIESALGAEFACGEALVEARAVIQRALKGDKRQPEKCTPAVKTHPLCAPLADKAPPKVRKATK